MESLYDLTSNKVTLVVIILFGMKFYAHGYGTIMQHSNRSVDGNCNPLINPSLATLYVFQPVS